VGSSVTGSGKGATPHNYKVADRKQWERWLYCPPSSTEMASSRCTREGERGGFFAFGELLSLAGDSGQLQRDVIRRNRSNCQEDE